MRQKNGRPPVIAKPEDIIMKDKDTSDEKKENNENNENSEK